MGNANPSLDTGWRVLAVHPRGPCRECRMIPFFDYIIGINGKRLDGAAVSIKEELVSNCNKPTEFTVLNYKTKKTRKLTACPNNDWGGIGMLGLMIANDNFQTADDRVVRVLCVFSQSPAEAAGLHPFVDYILGTDLCIFNGLDEFEEYILRRLDQEIRLRVYNSNICQVREVRITPTEDWSESTDQGVLGCEVSCGILHKIPDVLPETVITAHESTFSKFSTLNTEIELNHAGGVDEDVPVDSSKVNFSFKGNEVSSNTPEKCLNSGALSSTVGVPQSEGFEQNEVPSAAENPKLSEVTNTLIASEPDPVVDPSLIVTPSEIHKETSNTKELPAIQTSNTKELLAKEGHKE